MDTYYVEIKQTGSKTWDIIFYEDANYTKPLLNTPEDIDMKSVRFRLPKAKKDAGN